MTEEEQPSVVSFGFDLNIALKERVFSGIIQ